MLSNYFKVKTRQNVFSEGVNDIIKHLQGKKVLIYGAGEGFKELNKQYGFTKKLNVIAIADKKFEENDTATFMDIKAIKPADITEEDYDFILVSNENYKPIVKYLLNNLCIEDTKVRTVFNEKIRDERDNLNYLYQFHFDKTFPKLAKKLRNKTIVLYGAGVFLELIQEYFGLDKLNIIAIADKKYEIYNEEESFLGYKIIAPSEIQDLKPDYVLMSTKYYINIFEYLTEDLLKGTKIKVKPLVKKSFIALVKEVWGI